MDTAMLESFFKAETRAAGEKLWAQEKLALTGGSDTAVQAYVKASPPVRVRLSAQIGGANVAAECSCPAGKKGQLCKHIWAALRGTATKYPDFLDAKASVDALVAAPDERSARQDAFQASAKARAAEYRQGQYQKQKRRVRDLKAGVSEALSRRWPEEVQLALAYFALNGFPMEAGPAAEVIAEAKKKLSRVFHPDKGGSNDEMVELNRHCELLLRWV